MSTITDHDRETSLHAALRVLVFACSAFVMLLFVVTACMRVRYPYELEELEGYVFLTALRVAHGQAVYPRPSIAFVPYMYPPVYYYASAWLGRLMGMSLTTMRTVSIVSTLASFGAIAALVGRETRRWLPAIAAAGLYAGCYTLSEEWFDLGRLDALFVLFILLAMYATRFGNPIFAALLWTLAFQTKQTILPAALLMLCWKWRDRRSTLLGVTTLAVAVALSVAWLNHATQGWYGFTVFRIPAANADIKFRKLAVFWPQDLLRPLGLALAVIGAAIAFTRAKAVSLWRAINGSDTVRFWALACGLAPLCWWVRGHNGSSPNSLMPLYALVAVLFGLALARLLAWAARLPIQTMRTAILLVLAAALAQELAGIYNPGDYRPSRSYQAGVAAAVDDIRNTPGDVLVLQHPYYAWLASKPVGADLVSFRDASRVAAPLHDELRAELQQTLTEHPPAAVVLDSPDSLGDLEKLLGFDNRWESHYPVQQQLFGVPQGTRPDWLLRR